MKRLKSELTSNQIQYLKNLKFSDVEPGTLLKDFSSLLDFMGTTGIPVSKKNHLFAIKLLPLLNQLMSTPLDIKLKRPQQKSFPHLNGLYLLLRASGLTHVVFDKKEAKLMLNTKVLASWNSLNPSERYFALFYAWWHRGSDEIIGEHSQGFIDNYFYESACFFHKALGKSLDIKKNHINLENLRYNPGLHNLALMELFGFVQIELNSVLSKENWPIVKIKPMTWGCVLLKCFSKEISLFDDFAFEPSDDNQAESWGSGLKTYIPTWEKNLDQADRVDIKEGTVIFKISLGKVYRKLSVPVNISLDELAGSILSAFNFCNDHLYEFIYKNDYGVTERIVHSYVENDYELYTSEYVVGELPLYEGMELIFHFDFGDDWRFLLAVESITYENSRLQEATVIEQHGNPPKQYPEWDD